MKPTKLFHCTTQKKAKLYRGTGHIISPVRGFDSFQAALAWCVKTGRTVILELDGWSEEDIHKLPDHHNKYGMGTGLILMYQIGRVYLMPLLMHK